MTIQSLERTLADKVFALCDYYLEGKIRRHSRHIYDIFMLLPMIPLTADCKKLVHEIRLQRSKLNICPSAVKRQNIPRLLNAILQEKVYEEDYAAVTTYFQNKPVTYEKAITAIQTLASSDVLQILNLNNR